MTTHPHHGAQGSPDDSTASVDDTPQGIVAEIWDFMKVRKKFWLAPIILTLLLLGLLIIFAGSAGVVSPFVYAM